MYAFIVNPNSRSGLGLKTWRRLEQILKERGIAYQVCITRYPCHASEFAREMAQTHKDLTLIALGGDGSINEVVNGIPDLADITFGYIPIGSGNDFARSMKLGEDPEKILEEILISHTFSYIDIGRTVYGNTARRFAVSSGIGFDAEVCFRNPSGGLKKWLNKLKLGKLSYTLTALVSLLFLNPEPATITLDDGTQKTFQRFFFAAAMNQRYEGGGFCFCPAARPADGILDIIVIADMPRIKALLLLPTAFAGLHVHFKGVHIFSCTSADIKSKSPLAVHTDGEPLSRETSVTFSLEPEKLKFIQPQIHS